MKNENCLLILFRLLVPAVLQVLKNESKRVFFLLLLFCFANSSSVSSLLEGFGGCHGTQLPKLTQCLQGRHPNGERDLN